jgi:segregation and condensation protein A
MLVQQDVYTIQLPHFEGPFDLLLFFIERDELDIQDIPISKITRDFLDYIHQMDQLNMEVASEFILVAGTLMKIKARMLIPRPTVNEKGQVEDPRTELVSRLLEYKRYKEVQDDLRDMEEDAAERLVRRFAIKEEQYLLKSEFAEEELNGIDLYDIMRTFKRVWDRHSQKMAAPRHVIRKYPYSMDEVKDNILNRLAEKEKIDFVSFVLDTPERIFCVFTFLSVLEMAAQGKIHVVVGKGYNNFWIARPELRPELPDLDPSQLEATEEEPTAEGEKPRRRRKANPEQPESAAEGPAAEGDENDSPSEEGDTQI